MANRSPPIPFPVGSISPSAALAAMAASIAEPPWRIVSSAIWVASGCEVAAIACGAITSERVANSSPVIRSSSPVIRSAAGATDGTRASDRKAATRMRMAVLRGGGWQRR